MGAKLILSARNEEKLKEMRDGLANPEDARYNDMIINVPTSKI